MLCRSVDCFIIFIRISFSSSYPPLSAENFQCTFHSNRTHHDHRTTSLLYVVLHVCHPAIGSFFVVVFLLLLWLIFSYFVFTLTLTRNASNTDAINNFFFLSRNSFFCIALSVRYVSSSFASFGCFAVLSRLWMCLYVCDACIAVCGTRTNDENEKNAQFYMKLRQKTGLAFAENSRSTEDTRIIMLNNRRTS